MAQSNITRSVEREFAFKMLYAAQFNSDPLEEQIPRLEERQQKKATPFVKKLIGAHDEHQEQIDELIRRKLKNWDFDRIAITDKILIRIALVEMLYFPDIPVEVSINEAIELAKKFSTEQSSKFINGVLDAVFQYLKNENKISKQESGIVTHNGV